MQMYFWSLLLYTWKVQQPKKRFYLTNCSAAWVRTRGENQRPEIRLCLLAKLWALLRLAYDFSSSQWKPALRKLIWEFLTTNFNPHKATEKPINPQPVKEFFKNLKWVVVIIQSKSVLTIRPLQILPKKRGLKLVEQFSGHCRAIKANS